MRLLNVTTFNVEEFMDRDTLPLYAILSHTWGNEEVLFKEMQEPLPCKKLGWAKIEGCCAQAAADGFDYVWIDTCCIDSTSSVELSEAINSMYTWYMDAEVCYAYLSDVQSGKKKKSADSSFMRSRWFTRGWTLQELLAPSTVIFYDKNWVEIGTKASLKTSISEAAGIDHEALVKYEPNNFSVATRMSWASKRKTTRVEDEAYCLIGIFEVNMQMLYGEGNKAFARLQHEILKESKDESILAWTSKGTEIERGPFASSPAEFENCATIRKFSDSTTMQFLGRTWGLKLELFFEPRVQGRCRNLTFDERHAEMRKMHWDTMTDCNFEEPRERDYPETATVVLKCQYMNDDLDRLLLIHLKKVTGTSYVRIKPQIIQSGPKYSYVSINGLPVTLVEPKTSRSMVKHSSTLRHFIIRGFSFENEGYKLSEASPSDLAAVWRRDGLRVIMQSRFASIGGLKFEKRKRTSFVVLLGVSQSDGTLWCDIEINEKDASLHNILSSYTAALRSSKSPQRPLDRITKISSQGVILRLATRPSPRTKRVSLVEITITDPNDFVSPSQQPVKTFQNTVAHLRGAEEAVQHSE